jgi:hypothetical protein
VSVRYEKLDARLIVALNRAKTNYFLVNVELRKPLTAKEEKLLGRYGIVDGWGSSSLNRNDITALSDLDCVLQMSLANRYRTV